MGIDNNDWRLSFGQTPEIYQQYQWSLKPWTSTDPNWDHDHCEFCFQKISNLKEEDSELEGWTDDEKNHWICKTCFEDFQDMYQWNLK